MGAADKTLQVYDQFYHEVCNDPGRSLALGDISTWIEAHLDRTSV
jgi:alpha-beta hydrolase superfamily lysophospholipase